MSKTSHNIPIDDEDWICLGVYALNKKTTKAKLIRKEIRNFLNRNEDEINKFRKNQEKAMHKRNLI